MSGCAEQTNRCHPYHSLSYVVGLLAGLPDAKGWISLAHWGNVPFICRSIGRDRMAWDICGPYPFLPAFEDWHFQQGIETLRQSGAVTVVLVEDPLFPFPEGVGWDVAWSYKRHYLIDLSVGEYCPSHHHRQEICRAVCHKVEIERVKLAERLSEWCKFYEEFICGRVQSDALHRFAPAYQAALADLGAELWRCEVGGQLVAASVWLRHGDTAYYHLAATSPLGRRVSAGYVLVDVAVHSLLNEGTRKVLLGSGLSRLEETPCGLERFKAGFANVQRVNHIFGCVFDRKSYSRLCTATSSDRSFFPAYRSVKHA